MKASDVRILVVLLWCAACGGTGSGVDGDKRVTSLGDSEIRALCEYLTSLDPPRTIDCGDGHMFMVGGQSVEDCIAEVITSQVQYPGCEATVDDREACAEAIAKVPDGELCTGDVSKPPQCDPLLTVECGGG